MKTPRFEKILAATLITGALVIGASACASTDTAPSGTNDASTTPASTTEALEGSITVFAAASLTKTFTALGAAFEEAHPGTHVTFSFAGSSDLVTQLTEGAPADVFASADEANMAKVTTADLASGAPIDFATNVLTIAVPPGNPAKVTSFADLASPDVKTVVCAPQVPCGTATVKIEIATGVTLTPVSEESSVTDVLGKVSSGEADAGLVYVTDVTSAGASVESVGLPEASAAVNTYPITALTGSSNGALAAAFVAFVMGPDGQKVLTIAGFGTP
ncbi:molybdate ABC transporter substrate-binding protein [Leifsonia sp. A12D58]|uniref:molybdate ABC transporter substrate-binding protein n=1 Tax=Leifsonia sp. A12D58 TaxID=3397674 RepID=UPI0039DF7A2A